MAISEKQLVVLDALLLLLESGVVTEHAKRR